MKKHIRLFEILFCIFSFVLAALIAVYIVAGFYEDRVNDFFGTTSVRYETADGEEVDFTQNLYFESDFADENELSDYYAALVQEVEGEGIVLMKNDNGALPIESGAKVSLFGQGSVNLFYSATGSSGKASSSEWATLKDALKANGVDVNEELWDFYLAELSSSDNGRWGDGSVSSPYVVWEPMYDDFTAEVKATYSDYGDAAIVTISRESGEGADINVKGSDGMDGSYLSLTSDEIDLLKELTTLKNGGTFKSIIVLLNSSSMIQLDFLKKEGIDVDSVLWVGSLGSHGVYGVTDVLCGNVNPSGKNVDTYLYDNCSSPAMASWSYNDDKRSSQPYRNATINSGTGYPDDSPYGSITMTNGYYDAYVEGIYVGYRYYETRYEDYVLGNTQSYDYGADVAYPFGYGLSYTTFGYSDFEVTPSDDGYDVSVTVTNTGSVAGKEVVEVYLQKPYTPYDKANGVEKASVELVGYEKTKELKSGDSEKVTITVENEQFKSYDSNEAETYILENGDYYLAVGQNGAHDAVNNILAAKGYTTDNGMDASGNSGLASCISLTYENADTNGVDAKTYSVSTETGAEITNQLDFADPNKYENYDHTAGDIVTYVSRSDWQGTFPAGDAKLSIANQAMYNDLQSDDDSKYDMNGGSMPKYKANAEYSIAMLSNLMAGANSENAEEISYDDEMWDAVLDQMTYDDQVELVGNGYHRTAAVSRVAKPLTSDQNGPISVDGSLTIWAFPCEGIWAASFNDELIGRIGELLGNDCLMAGVQGLYAPGVNIHRTSFCGRTAEYFSEDPYLSAMASVDEIKGLQSKGVLAYVKHFAFNDCDDYRNGNSVWLNEQSAREIYLLPFEYSMKSVELGGANAHACMTSFNRAGCKWTGACSELLINIARDEWNYEGFYLTDASEANGGDYMTALDGVMNGTNIYDGNNTSDSGFSKYAGNAAFCTMLRESCHRILYNVANYSAAMNGFTEDTVVIDLTPWWMAMVIALLVIAIVGTAAALILYVIAEVFKWLDKRNDAGNDGGGVRPKDADGEPSGDTSPGDRE